MKKRGSLRFVRGLALLIAVFVSVCPTYPRAEQIVSVEESKPSAGNGISMKESGQSAGSGISIDNSRKYEGMDAPFAKGYEPSIEKNVMTLVVPFVSDADVEKNRITVGIDFESGQDGPFYYKNYRKSVKRSEGGIYLYRCRLKLKEDRVNGQYPLHLWVEGNGTDGRFCQEFTIYVEITDGKPKAGDVVRGEDVSGDGAGDVQSDIDGTFSGEDSPQPVEQDFSEPPQSSGEEKNSQPRLMITGNSLQGNALEAGSSTTWSIAVQNCSNNHNVENVKVTLISDNKDVAFEKTSWYFEKTAPKKTMDLSQNLTVAKKAAAEPVQVQFQIEYEDEKGESYTSTEEVRLSICQPQQAQLVNLSFPEQVYASDTEFMSFQVLNTGLSTIYNVTVRLEGKGLFPQQEVFLGNIEGGSSADGEQKVFVGTLDMDAQGNVVEEDGKKYGDTSGTVIFSYENEQGEVTEQKLEIHTKIQEAEIVELTVEEEKPKTNQWWITIIFFVIAVLVLVIVWLYLRMKYYQRMRV